MSAVGFDPYDPHPDNVPQWSAIYDKNSMAMTPQIQQMLAGINLNNQGLNKFRGMATRNGPSDWAKQANRQQDFEAKNALDMGARDTAGQTAQARSNLAMKGGLSGGAAERLATAGGNNYLNMAQGVHQENARNKMQIGANDAQNQIQQLGMLPGMEVQALSPEFDKAKLTGQALQIDTQNQMANNVAENAFNIDRYHEQMAAWGAKQTADATKSGKKGK